MNLKTLLLTTLAVSLSATIKAQVQELARPKLVVGLVIDQMRWDYLYRYIAAMLHIQAPSGCIGQPIQLRQN